MRGTRPERLAEKLLQIRCALGLSQTDMLRRLGLDGTIPYTYISKYEVGRSVPPLAIVLSYARAANVMVEALIDDEIDLPYNLPARKRHEGVPRKRRKG